MHLGSVSNQQTRKPEIIITYNATKGSVDTLDQMCQAMNCSRKTKRLPLCLFYIMINQAAVNTYVIYVNNSTEMGSLHQTHIQD